MREILFRGKTNLGKWIEGDLLNYLGCGKVHIAQNYKGAGGQEVIPETVGQYTGLTDKNGKKIFEGDIVNILTENEEIGVVIYDEAGFWVEADGFCVDFHSNINGTDLEVIGNIHDNPELLKGAGNV